jgi:hypothetical protein
MNERMSVSALFKQIFHYVNGIVAISQTIINEKEGWDKVIKSIYY